MHNNKRKYKRAEFYGRMAEYLAMFWFKLHGYNIIAHRLKTPAGEIDMIICKSNLYIIVEIKWRSSRFKDKQMIMNEIITSHQKKRLLKGAEWCRGRLIPLDSDMRLDVFAMQRYRFPIWLKNAIQY